MKKIFITLLALSTYCYGIGLTINPSGSTGNPISVSISDSVLAIVTNGLTPLNVSVTTNFIGTAANPYYVTNFLGTLSNPMITAIVNTNEPRVGFYGFATNFVLNITNTTTIMAANYCMTPLNQISGLNRIDGYGVYLQSMCLIGGDSVAPNIAGFVVYRTPDANWVQNSLCTNLLTQTNLMTFIPMSSSTSTNVVGANTIIEWANMGKYFIPATNSMWIGAMSAVSAVHNNTNDSYLNMHFGRD